MIKKVKGKYVVLSEKTGRSFGSYKTLAEAKNRLRPSRIFQNAQEAPGDWEKVKKKVLSS